jgi:hypothetical protein
VSVELSEGDLPISVTLDGMRREVEEVGERWRIDDEWWREHIARRYVEVMLVGGGHVVVYEDLVNGGWFLQQ